MTAGYLCEYAWLPGGDVRQDVLVEVTGGRIAAVTPHATAAGVTAAGATAAGATAAGVTALPGLVLPGLANAHSHAFHRALRGRTHGDGGTFWTWRERMYAVAARLGPDSYRRLATAAFAEMACSGVTCVGEFHYLHHRPDGTRYPDPNAVGLALVDAARQAGLRITLLDTCYLAGGLGPDGHTPLAGPQARFGDGDAAGWRARVEGMKLPGHARLGAAIHSVRAVPAGQLGAVAAAARDLDLPLHVHLSEQPAENEAALAYYGLTPAQLLAGAGALTPATTAVHATHLTAQDITLLGAARAAICACPTTEADLADGIGPFPELTAAGARLCVGSDQHAHVDLLEETRRIEHHERLRSGRRGTFTPAGLLDAVTHGGHAALGWPDAGRLEPGRRADLVAIDLGSPRTAGSLPAQAAMAATAADIYAVVIDGTPVVTAGRHRLGDVGRLLADAIAPLWEEPWAPRS